LGGLGVKDLAAHNRSMLMKWHWRCNLEDPRLWKDVITAKYGSHSNWTSNSVTIPHGKGRVFEPYMAGFFIQYVF